MNVNESLAAELRFAIGRNKIKYSVLKSVVTLKKLKNIHINLNGILNYISLKYLSKIDYCSDYKFVIASSVINLVGHYRHYCVGRGYTPNIYMYASQSNNEMINDAIRMVSIISAYLPGTYFIKVNDDDLPCTYMKYTIDDGGHHLILTKDIVDIQLVSEKCHVLQLNKDNSIYYNDTNLYSSFLGEEIDTNLSIDLIGPVIFYSGHGLKNSGVKKFGKKKTIKEFEEMISNDRILNSRYASPDDFIHDMREYADGKDMLNFKRNFNLYNLNTRYEFDIDAPTAQKIDSCIIDKFSKSDLQNLNVKYFTGLDSLVLEWLVEEAK